MWRGDFRLGHVIDPHGALSAWCRAGVDFILEPIVEDWRRDAAAARFPALIDEREKFVGALAGFCGKKNDRRVAEEFQFGAIIFRSPTSAGRRRSFRDCDVRRERAWICLSPWRHRASGVARGYDGEIPLVNNDDDGPAGLFRITGDLCVACVTPCSPSTTRRATSQRSRPRRP